MQKNTLGVVAAGVILTTAIVISVLLQKKSTPPNTDQFIVVTTLFPYYDFARQIVGDKGVVENLFPTGAGAHDVALTPQAVELLSRADLLVMNGAGLESYLDITDIQKNNPELVVVQMASVEGGFITGEEGEDGGVNPHVWLSPITAVKMVKLLGDTIITADPANRTTYTKNAKRLAAEVGQLNTDYTAAIEQFTTKKFIAFHDALPNFARDYGLEQVAVIEEFPGEAPTPEDLIALQALITSQDVRVILTEPQFSPRTAESIATDTGAKLAEFDTVETGDIATESYISKMKQNLENLQAVMK